MLIDCLPRVALLHRQIRTKPKDGHTENLFCLLDSLLVPYQCSLPWRPPASLCQLNLFEKLESSATPIASLQEDLVKDEGGLRRPPVLPHELQLCSLR